MIFQSEREEGNPFYQMYLLDLLSGDTTRVSPGIGKTTCGFFQPGTGRVLFASTHADPEALAKQKAELEMRASGKQRRYSWDYDETMDIYSCNQDGTEMVNLTNSPGYDAEGAYSPDGKQIVFCSLRAAFPLEKLSPEQVRSTELAGEKIKSVITAAPGNGAPIGGLKVTAENGWFAARPSGTEDIYKIYAESFRGADHLRRILEEAQSVVNAALAPAVKTMKGPTA